MYKHESQMVDQCSRLYDSSVSGDSFEANSSRIIQVRVSSLLLCSLSGSLVIF